MAITEIKSEGLEKEYLIVISKDDIENSFQQEMKDLAKKANIPGFRPGKVPLNFLEKKYGESLYLDVVNNSLEKNTDDFIKNNKLDLASKLEIVSIKQERGSDIECTIKFELMPEFDFPNLSEITLEKPVLKITDEVFQKLKDDYLQQLTTYELSEKSLCENMDMVNIDFEGFKDGVAFDGGKAENFDLVLGSGKFIPGFEEQLVGKSINEEFSIKVTFPDDYASKDLAGQETEFKIKIHKISSPKRPEFNDEIAKSAGCENVDELFNKLKQSWSDLHSKEVNNFLTLSLFNHLENTTDMLLPKSMVSRELDLLKKSFDSVESDLSAQDDVSISHERIVKRRVKIGLLLSKYAKNNNISITQQDLVQFILEQISDIPPNLKQMFLNYYLKDSNYLSTIQAEVFESKAVKEIVSKELKLKEVEMTLSDLEEKLELLSKQAVV